MFPFEPGILKSLKPKKPEDGTGSSSVDEVRKPPILSTFGYDHIADPDAKALAKQYHDLAHASFEANRRAFIEGNMVVIPEVIDALRSLRNAKSNLVLAIIMQKGK